MKTDPRELTDDTLYWSEPPKAPPRELRYVETYGWLRDLICKQMSIPRHLLTGVNYVSVDADNRVEHIQTPRGKLYPCLACGGKGEVLFPGWNERYPCGECKGAGFVEPVKDVPQEFPSPDVEESLGREKT